MTREDRKALQLFFARVALGRPFVAPPGLRAERMVALRKAFDDTMKDPEFLEDAKKQDLNADPITGGELAEIIASVYKTPADVVNRTVEALGRTRKDHISN